MGNHDSWCHCGRCPECVQEKEAEKRHQEEERKSRLFKDQTVVINALSDPAFAAKIFVLLKTAYEYAAHEMITAPKSFLVRSEINERKDAKNA